MQKVLEEPLFCPICLELPEQNIFQCQNGHTICDKCSTTLELCPQCRVPYGTARIRNRALEELIGGMQIACKHRQNGCGAEVLRKDLVGHLASCKFRPIGICKHIGYGDCEFVSSKPIDLFKHLQSVHNINRVTSMSSWESMTVIFQHIKIKQSDLFLKLLVEISTSCRILQVMHINVDQLEFSIFAIHFSENNICSYMNKIEVSAPEKDSYLTSANRPAYYTNLEKLIADPPFKIPIPFLLENMDSPEARISRTLSHTETTFSVLRKYVTGAP